VTVRPGDNITLHCDCKLSTGTYTVWFRNCSHENQPTLVLNAKPDEMWKHFQEYSRYEFMKNSSSDSYDLLIVNVTESDEGIYYCGTGDEGGAGKTNYFKSNLQIQQHHNKAHHQ